MDKETLKEILPCLFQAKIPLPNNPLQDLNAYIFKDPQRNLIIDTGMNRQECLDAMLGFLRELDVELEKTDFFITHMHADHCGLVGALAGDQTKIYCSQLDAEYVSGQQPLWDQVLESARLHGFPENILQEALEKHPGYKYAPRGQVQIDYVQDGDQISVGDYHFRCLLTPGHTPGHMCLYEPGKKLLVSGDHILDDITSNISFFPPAEEGNPLEDYLVNLDKVYSMDIQLVLPGHRRLVYDVRKRIDELKDHHRARAEEILRILQQGGASAYQVAAQMSWDIDCRSWEDFPTPQKWFATGEAIAHLHYLAQRGQVTFQKGRFSV